MKGNKGRGSQITEELQWKQVLWSDVSKLEIFG